MSQPKKGNYRGPTVVPFDNKALVRRFAKIFYKEISKPGVKNVGWVIERGTGMDRVFNVQSSHRDDSDAAESFAKAAHIMKGF